MKKVLGLFAIGAVMALPLTTRADTISFNYNYQGNDGVTASGILNGVSVSSGEYDILSGSIFVQGNTALDGAGTFVTNPGSGVFQTGGGTELILTGTNNYLFYPSNQYINDSGLFLFQMNSGLGLGLYSNEPDGPGYGLFGGNWQLVDSGNLSVNVAPEPASLLFVGTGLLVLAELIYLRRRGAARKDENTLAV